MLQSLLRNNFRAKLVIPVLIALLVMIISSITFTVVTQRSSSNALNKQVGTSFVDIESSIGDDLGELSQQLDNSLQRMQEEVSSRIEKASSETLQETAKSVQANMRTSRRQNCDNLIQLMAITAVNPVISKDFAMLNSYARNIHQNKDIVFLFYLDKIKNL